MVAKRTPVRLAKLTPLRPATTAIKRPAPLDSSSSSSPAIKLLTPGTAQPRNVPGVKAAPGRPATNIGQYLVKPTDKSKTGYEMLNADPAIIQQSNERYLKNFELPPALQPKYLRKPEVMEVARRKEISKGWVKPRNQVL